MDYFRCLESIEIPRGDISVHRELGKGQFGEVYEGTLKNPETGQLDRVAIKMLTKVDHSAQDHFFLEAMTMRKFSHPNIIKLIGVVSQSRPISIVMEIAQLGELRSFLRSQHVNLKLEHLLLYCYQISSALEYLASKQVVHRDIAARNILVFSMDLVKLADFGLSRLLQEHNYYKAVTKGAMPIKWMAPESIFYRKFTTASDVWMFAVCSWEIFHFGHKKPHQDLSNQQVVQQLDSGKILERPPACPKPLYNLWTQCWHQTDSQRPSFTHISATLKDLYLENSGKDPDDTLRKHGFVNTSDSDLMLAEIESKALKERLERSLRQSMEDSEWLEDQQRNLPFKLNNQHITRANSTDSQVPSPNSIRSSVDSSAQNGARTSFQRGSSLDSNQRSSVTSFNSPNGVTKQSFQNGVTNHAPPQDGVAKRSEMAEIERLAIVVLTYMYHIPDLVQSDAGLQSAQKSVSGVNEAMLALVTHIGVNKYLFTPDQRRPVELCCKLLQGDAADLGHAYRLALQLGSRKELLSACSLLTVDLKNTVHKIAHSLQ